MTDTFEGRPTEMVQTDAVTKILAGILFNRPVADLKGCVLAVQQEAWDAGYRVAHDRQYQETTHSAAVDKTCAHCGGHCCNLCGLWVSGGKYYCAACMKGHGQPMTQARSIT